MNREESVQDYILEYYQRIVDGREHVGKWIRLVYEYIIRGLEEKRFYHDLKRSEAAISWQEAHCFHTEGDLAPNPIRFELWQKAMKSCMYGIVDANGKRVFREIVLIIGRKNGKTLSVASDARYIWECGGYGTRIFNIAPKLDQADLVYNSVWMMTTLDPEYQEKNERRKQRDTNRRKIYGDDPTLERHRQTDLFIPGTNSSVKKIAFNAKKSDGFNPSLTICDEIASWEGDAGLKQYEVMKSAMGSRSESFLLSCSTAGYVNDSIFDELMNRSTRFLNGESKETRLLPFIYMIDDVEKWNDINELKKANPNLGVSISIDYMLEEIAIAEGSLSKKTEFLVKYCNVKQNSSQAFLRASDVNKCVCDHLDPEQFRGCYCVGGIDLSRTTDLTSACAVIEKDGLLYVLSHFWLPAERIEEATQKDGLPYQAFIQRGILSPSGTNFVDYQDCMNWYTDLVETYEILPLQVGYDRYNSQYLTQAMTTYGFHMDDVFQGENLSPVIDECEGLIKDGRIRIGDNDLLKIHMLDSAVKTSVERNRKRLIKVSNKVHIDGMAALLDALTVRQKWYGEIGSQLAND